jgi:hypothetical protein
MTARCFWCNGGGELVQMPVMGARSDRYLLVHPEHERELHAFLLASEHRMRRLLAVLAAALIAAVPALAIASLFGAPTRTAVAGAIVLVIGAAAWRYPIATPPLMRSIGARNARNTTRLIAALCTAVGLLLMAAAFGI